MLYVGSAQNIKIPEGRFKLLPGLSILFNSFDKTKNTT